jgi:DMSO/TMAO reductase YedYZ heme-binding membrane subunit
MDTKRTGLLQGWTLTLLLALGVAAMALGMVAWSHFTVEGVRMAIRATARTSLIFFSLAIASAGLARLWPNAATAWLRRNRRYLGVSFAASHAVHAVAIAAFGLMDREALMRETMAANFAVGGIAYVFILAMAATSFDRTAAWIGPRAWGLLHTTGVYYIWLVFLVSGGKRAVMNPTYWLYVVALLAVMGLRHAARLRRSAPALR